MTAIVDQIGLALARAIEAVLAAFILALDALITFTVNTILTRLDGGAF